MRSRTAYALALSAQVAGAAAVLLVASRTWQTVVPARPAAVIAADSVALRGRDLDAAPTALALVALAGAVAVVATRGWVRRAVGVLVALAGSAAVERSIAAGAPLGRGRALDLVRQHHPARTFDPSVAPHVSASWAPAAVSAVAAALVALAGLAVALRGASWPVLSARYERASGPARLQASDAPALRAQTALWNALDRGEDPTAEDRLRPAPPAPKPGD
jgi:uncharacterized membrane protein (TIGR02234 family)